MLRSFLIYLSKAAWAQKLVTGWSFSWRAASRFVAGEKAEDAIRVIRVLNEKGINATLDHLGEHTSKAEEAANATEDILAILDAIDKAKVRANVSIKLTQIGMGLDERTCHQNLIRILERARAQNNFIRIDFVDTPYTDITISTYHAMLERGFTTHNMYSLIGSMRSGAQIVSYELSVGLSLLTMIIMAGSLRISEIVDAQSTGWFIFRGHIPAVIAFFIFVIAGTAETNRGPFDLAEAESELTAGFHTEYSGIKFAFFFLAEYMNMFIVAGIGATVFFGGWMPLHIGSWEGFNRIMDYMPPFVWFFGKTGMLIFLMMWFKWTFPRLRIHQLLTLEWKFLLPINLVNILVMALVSMMGWHF